MTKERDEKVAAFREVVRKAFGELETSQAEMFANASILGEALAVVVDMTSKMQILGGAPLVRFRERFAEYVADIPQDPDMFRTKFAYALVSEMMSIVAAECQKRGMDKSPKRAKTVDTPAVNSDDRSSGT